MRNVDATYLIYVYVNQGGSFAVVVKRHGVAATGNGERGDRSRTNQVAA